MSPSPLRLADGALRAPWRVAVFAATLAVAMIGFVSLGLAIASTTPIAAWARLARVPLDQVAMVGALVFATWLTGRLVHGAETPVWPRAGLGRGCWRPPAVMGALGVGAAVILVPAMALVAAGGAQFVPATATDSAAFVAWSAFALLVPAAVSEELLFRGYVFDACISGMGRWGAVAATSLAFALAHLFNPDPGITSIVAVGVAGAFLGIVRLTTGSLVASSAAHLGINYAQAVGLHATVSGLALQTPGFRFVLTGPAWLTGGSWGPEGGAGVIAALTVASFLYLRMRRNATRGASPDGST